MLGYEGDQLLFRREQGGRWNVEGRSDAELALGQLGTLTGYLIDKTTVVIERFVIDD